MGHLVGGVNRPVRDEAFSGHGQIYQNETCPHAVLCCPQQQPQEPIRAVSREGLEVCEEPGTGRGEAAPDFRQQV